MFFYIGLKTNSGENFKNKIDENVSINLRCDVMLKCLLCVKCVTRMFLLFIFLSREYRSID